MSAQQLTGFNKGTNRSLLALDRYSALFLEINENDLIDKGALNPNRGSDRHLFNLLV
jgi:hypothetical protein